MANENVKRLNKLNSKTFLFRFHKIKDRDIIDKLESVGNKSKYIKNLIRQDMSL